MKTCRDYVGPVCVDGSCPRAWRDYAGSHADAVVECENCFYNRGCEDCALLGTEFCDEISDQD